MESRIVWLDGEVVLGNRFHRYLYTWTIDNWWCVRFAPRSQSINDLVWWVQTKCVGDEEDQQQQQQHQQAAHVFWASCRLVDNCRLHIFSERTFGFDRAIVFFFPPWLESPFTHDLNLLGNMPFYLVGTMLKQINVSYIDMYVYVLLSALLGRDVTRLKPPPTRHVLQYYDPKSCNAG